MGKIYLMVPNGVRTGGPEALYQLSDALLRGGREDVFVAYYRGTEIAELISGRSTGSDFLFFNLQADQIHEYQQYLHQPTEVVVDAPENVVVLPEPLVGLIPVFRKAKVLVWWLSVDNAFRALGEINLNQLRRPTVFHATQSFYAHNFVMALGLRSVGLLSDFTASQFLLQSEAMTKDDLVAVNANFKVISDLDALERLLVERNPKIRVSRIVNMPREKVLETLAAAKAYVDLGTFPGKDRMPREAALLGCLVFLSTSGAGANAEDYLIPDSQRGNCWDLVGMADAIVDACERYESQLACQNNFVVAIQREREIFKEEVAKVFAAIEAASSVGADDISVQGLVKQGEYFYGAGDLERAVAAFSLCLEHLTGNLLPYLYLAQICMARAMYEDAMPFLEHAALLAEPSDRDLIIYLTGYCLLEQGRPAEALARVLPQIAENGRYAGLHVVHADTLRHLGRFEEAVVALEKAASLGADVSEVAKLLAVIQEATDKS